MINGKWKITIFAFITVLIIAGAGYFSFNKFWSSRNNSGSRPALSIGEWWKKPSAALPESATVTVDSGKTPSITTGDLSRAYVNDVYGFSFRYPEGLSVSDMPEETGDLVLVQGLDQNSFQIFITPFDEPAAELTHVRIQADLPGIKIDNAQNIVFGGGNIPALIFESENQSIGKTREIWFVWPPEPLPHGNYLYQVTAYSDTDAFLGPILETWSLNGQ